MEDVFKISKDKERAKDMLKLVKDREELLKLIPKDKAFKVIEDYYEIIKELLTAIMYLDGYKTLSHVKLIEYFALHYSELNEMEIKLIDNMRKFRIGTMYYGKDVTTDFLENTENDIQKIVRILTNLVARKIK